MADAKRSAAAKRGWETRRRRERMRQRLKRSLAQRKAHARREAELIEKSGLVKRLRKELSEAHETIRRLEFKQEQLQLKPKRPRKVRYEPFIKSTKPRTQEVFPVITNGKIDPKKVKKYVDETIKGGAAVGYGFYDLAEFLFEQLEDFGYDFEEIRDIYDEVS